MDLTKRVSFNTNIKHLSQN